MSAIFSPAPASRTTRTGTRSTTRPGHVWDVHPHIGTYVERECKEFLGSYWRALQQGQSKHIELVGEKNTISGIIRPIAEEYAISMTLGRGYSSGSPRQKMLNRFRKSGKDKLALIVISDPDPEGDDIAQAFAKSLRDDFHIPEEEIELVKAALTEEQALGPNLPKLFTAKEKSARAKKFTDRHRSDTVHEPEAPRPEVLQPFLRDAIERAMDVPAYNREQEAEARDWDHLENIRAAALEAIMPPLKPMG